MKPVNTTNNAQNQPILRLEDLAKLHKGDSVSVIYARIPTTMLYFGPSSKEINTIQLVELPKVQDKYLLFSVYEVSIDSLFQNGQAELYPTAEKIPRKITQGNTEYSSISNLMKTYDITNGRILPEQPVLESNKPTPHMKFDHKTQKDLENISNYDSQLKVYLKNKTG